jgi:tRNA 2-selenouridine synthase
MKPVTLSALSDLATLDADTVIDVRSPAEFEEDHLPGAINLPVLSNAERAEVGTIYKRQSPFTARKIGGALVARNTAAHLQGPLAEKGGDWRPVVYCWRGGQRSGAFATILSQVGWRVGLVQGGYRSYRRLVVQALYDTPLRHRFIVVEGGTGTAKTRLLDHLSQQGAQVLDLEGLANHRGSLFGAMPGGQPSQKSFESRIAGALGGLAPAQPTFVEAESSKVGDCLVPPSLWTAMQAAPRLAVEAPVAARAAFLCRAYDDLTADPARLHQQIEALRPYHPKDRIAEWLGWAGEGAFEDLAAALVSHHYDPRYAKSAAAAPAPRQRYRLDDLDEPSLSACAARIISETAAPAPASSAR